jgi:hypothetical protein
MMIGLPRGDYWCQFFFDEKRTDTNNVAGHQEDGLQAPVSPEIRSVPEGMAQPPPVVLIKAKLFRGSCSSHIFSIHAKKHSSEYFWLPT